jgi:hypothetical protein
VRLEGLGKFKKSNDLIGTRTRDLPACSIVSQPTTLPMYYLKRNWAETGESICIELTVKLKLKLNIIKIKITIYIYIYIYRYILFLRYVCLSNLVLLR